MKKIENYINGSISKSTSKKVAPVFDPSIGEIQSEVSLSNKSDFEKTLNSSLDSFYQWSEVTP